ncbi:MAG: hypothetical protein J1F33_02755 [Clostridiales bacterium]|nr:hypothetical protein [Clostridiales bacterium]
MEEEEVIVVDDEESPLSKEDILDRSRKENEKMGDERERQFRQYGIAIGSIVGMVLLLVIYLVDVFALNRNSYEIIGVMVAINGFNMLWQGIYGNKFKKLFLAVGIISLVMSVAYFVMWIVDLVG